eukprot:TRINITY_DN85_c0_g2_i1.p1 TRINITY_DN85_c0_g2~~TRINITY_DN85_c0_g2_i1.p1  ORF type:complete len:214 (+),score=50.98 TRINITY_DN85_c0_g2_i1:178-819(+)
MIRPIALKAVSSIRKALPDFPILGVGGIDSAESALQMINAGASVIQITSAIQNQEYTIIDELVYGLKALLYMKSRPDLAAWRGQAPPLSFVPPKKESIVSGRVPTVASQIGISVPFIKVVPDLELAAQVRAVIDQDRCLKCGKCYMTCNDTGYTAIVFDPVTHKTEVQQEDCMGCGLCQSVCPADCITYQLKTIPHKVHRGIPESGLEALPFS